MSNSEEIDLINLFPIGYISSQVGGYGKTTLTSTKENEYPVERSGFFII